MSQNSLGDRIKMYEDAYRSYLPQRLPLIIRLDGKGWHQYTKSCQRPFDLKLVAALDETAIYLCQKIQGVKIAYLQSDEISLLIYNSGFETQAWFDNNLQKMCSVSAGMASSYFTAISSGVFGQTKITQFDARCFIVPFDEVVNAFIFRQQDATRNSIQMAARSLYSHKELFKKNNGELMEMCFQRGVNWNDYPTSFKRGRCIIKVKNLKETLDPTTGEKITVERSQWVVDNQIPIFSQDRDYIEKYLTKEPE